jgi:hypothetical protein
MNYDINFMAARYPNAVSLRFSWPTSILDRCVFAHVFREQHHARRWPDFGAAVDTRDAL